MAREKKFQIEFSHCQVVLCEEDLCIGLNTQVDFLIETQTGTVSLKKRVKRVI